MLTKIPFSPGIRRDDAPLAVEGAWVDADHIRFVDGRPQVIGGWETVTTARVGGRCRGLHGWADNAGGVRVALGTHTGLYALSGGDLTNITPAGLAAGAADGTGGAGYGTGAYGRGAFGAASAAAFYPRTWTLDNWGEHLVACPRGGPLYQWRLSGVAVPITGAPATAAGIFVTSERILVAYGAAGADGVADPMLIRWSDQEDNTAWTPAPTNAAGDFRLAAGSRIVRALPARGQSLVWTDAALYAMRFLGDAEMIHSFTLLGAGCGLIGPNAAVEKDGAAYWLGNNGQFYVFTGGAPQPIPCPVRRHVCDHLALAQADKIVAGTVAAFNEVWWFYPDARDGTEVSRYAALNTTDGTWTIGSFDRTAWRDAGVLPHPIGVASDGSLYYHERLASANGGALSWHLESAPLDGEDGERLVHLAAIIPDFDGLEGGCTVEVVSRLSPRGPEQRQVIGTVGPDTVKLDCRVTARQIALRLSGAAAPAAGRLGALAFDLRGAGARR